MTDNDKPGCAAYERGLDNSINHCLGSRYFSFFFVNTNMFFFIFRFEHDVVDTYNDDDTKDNKWPLPQWDKPDQKRPERWTSLRPQVSFFHSHFFFFLLTMMFSYYWLLVITTTPLACIHKMGKPAGQPGPPWPPWLPPSHKRRWITTSHDQYSGSRRTVHCPTYSSRNWQTLVDSNPGLVQCDTSQIYAFSLV